MTDPVKIAIATLSPLLLLALGIKVWKLWQWWRARTL